MPDFILRALIAGAGLVVVAAPFGCFMVWRRMAFFGAAIAHAALLGVAAATFTRIDPFLAILVTGILVALLLAWGNESRLLAGDTMLGIVAHAALALGLVLLAFSEGVRVDLMAYLFGDILAASWNDLAMLGAFGGGALLLIGLLWRPLLYVTLDADVARVDGVRARLLNLVFMLLLAVVVTVAVRLVGLLLVTAMMIMPAAAARRFAATPEAMAAIAALIGLLAVILGLAGAFALNTPAGPSIVVAAALLFLASWAARQAER